MTKAKTGTTLDDFLTIAVQEQASDLHLVADLPPIIRVDGDLREIPDQARLTGADTERLVFNILNEQQKAQFTEDRDLDMSYEVRGVSRFRVNLHYERDRVGLVARVISTTIPSMEEILMPAIVYELCRLKQGLVLVTGPTGCGKSTSLAAMINLINHERRAHVVTLEDPIEFLYEPAQCVIKQRQLGTDMLSFGQGLKHVLRQDPNVILVGEMRDLETIASTITLAETGHLVLATLHTLNAAQTVDRIIDVFPPYQQPQVRLQLSLFLRGIISQQLVRKVNGGRVAVREVLLNTPAVGNLIRENKIAQIKMAIQTSADEGMFTMDQDLRRLHKAGVIAETDALAHMMNPEDLRG